MYSIYDYYANDIENRYSNMKEKMSSGGSQKSNSPFIPNTTTAQTVSTPISQLESISSGISPSQDSTKLLGGDVAQSIYESSEGVSGPQDRDDMWGTGVNWSDYPSPPVFDYMAGAVDKGLQAGSSMFLGPLSIPANAAWNTLKSGDVTPSKFGEEFVTEGLQYGRGLGVGKAAGAVSSLLTTNNPLANMLISFGVKTGIGEAVNSLTGNIFGREDKDPYQESRSILGKGWDNFTGRYSNPGERTVGNPVTDPALAVGRYTGEVDNTNDMFNMTDNPPSYDPYNTNNLTDFNMVGNSGGSADSGGIGTMGGGPDGWSGDAWGDSWW